MSTTRHFVNLRIFPKFRDINEDFSVHTWIKLFEIHTADESDSERVVSLMYSLEGKAFDWYGQEIAGKERDWKQTCEMMINRFGLTSLTTLDTRHQRQIINSNTRTNTLPQCRICQQLGETAFHWHRSCQYRKQLKEQRNLTLT